jgi:hypothetical protein
MDDGRVTERSATVLDLIATGEPRCVSTSFSPFPRWNNAALQTNAPSLRFQLLTMSGATWQCLGYNPQGHAVLTTHALEGTAVESAVAFEVRRNGQGNVTGFTLNGADVAAVTYTEVGKCPSPALRAGWVQQPALVEDSLVYSGGGAPLLQVSSDGVIWHDLPVTPVL